MKNLIPGILIVLGITSCSKDSLDNLSDQALQPRLSEVMVSVNYLHWLDQCDTGCGNPGGETITSISNVKVELFKGELSGSDEPSIPFLSDKTNLQGNALLADLEPQTYTVRVNTPLGIKSRFITTQAHKRSYIDFSF